MLRVVKRSVRYVCGICHTKYRTARQALVCEASGREPVPQHLRRGSRVRATSERECSSSDRKYVCEGFVAGSVIELYEDEVHLKGFGVSRSSKHIRMYKVRYRCPRCREMKAAFYPAEHLVAR